MKKKVVAMLLSMAMISSGSVTAFAEGMDHAAVGEEVSAVQEAGEEDAASNVELDTEQNGSLLNQVVEDKLAAGRSANSYVTADSIALDTVYEDTVASDNYQHFYRFTLNESGTLQMKLIANFYILNCEILDQNGNSVWDVNEYWNSSSEQISTTEKISLTSGVYTIRFSTSYKGSYNFKLSNISSKETFKEGQGGSDNSFASANNISMGTTYFGQIAQNDGKDFYKFVLPTSGKVNLASTAYIQYLYYIIFDEDGNEIWRDNPYWNSSSEQISENEDVELTSGTYYIEIQQDGRRYGDYIFKLTFQSAGESFKETTGGSNNSMNTANVISLNSDYRGQLAHNDDKDFYKFTLSSADTITLSSTFYLEDIGYKIYNETGEEIWNENFWWDSTTKKKTISKSLELPAGTYYLLVLRRYSNEVGNYDFRINSNIVTNPSAVSRLRIGGRAGDALRLNWNKNTTADGYIIEQYKNGNWTRIARIGNNSTTTYRVENLNTSTKYNFRIRAFKLNGNTALYSTYTTISGTTNPAVISGLKISGRAGDAIRLNWNKNSKASGYIVVQYKNGNWVRVARIGNNSTTTYRIAGLTPSTTYQFRVRAFGFDGNTALYGSYAYINGKTNPATISGIRIGGTAKDALRVNWNRDSKASGYIVEQYKNGSWVRVGRIGDNNTTTYRISGLNAGTTYKFRVCAFGFDGNTATYGCYAYVDGTTNR